MAPRTLKKSWQFRVCYQQGHKAVGRYFVVFYHKHPDSQLGLQVGVVASRRVGGAVVRNRARRLLRVATRAVSDRLNDPDLWVVLIARSTIRERTSNDVQLDVEQTLENAGLIGSETRHVE